MGHFLHLIGIRWHGTADDSRWSALPGLTPLVAEMPAFLRLRLLVLLVLVVQCRVVVVGYNLLLVLVRLLRHHLLRHLMLLHHFLLLVALTVALDNERTIRQLRSMRGTLIFLRSLMLCQLRHLLLLSLFVQARVRVNDYWTALGKGGLLLR
jgi:hypothetical protein